MVWQTIKVKDILDFPFWYGIKFPNREPGTLGRPERYKDGDYIIKTDGGKTIQWKGVRLFAKIESGENT